MSIEEMIKTPAPELADPAGSGSAAGSLTPEFLAALRDGYQMSPSDRACHNAATNNDLPSLALNRSVIRGDDSAAGRRIPHNRRVWC